MVLTAVTRGCVIMEESSSPIFREHPVRRKKVLKSDVHYLSLETIATVKQVLKLKITAKF